MKTIAAVLLFTFAVGHASGADRRIRVAVEPFDYSAVRSHVSYVFGNDVHVGRGIRAMLITRMAQSDKYVLVERSEKLQTIMNEQDFALGDRVRQGSGPQFGNLSGADAYLVGEITAFGRDDKREDESKGMLGRVGLFSKKVSNMKISKKTEKAVVQIDYRLINASTGEIIDTGHAKGESSRESSSFSLSESGKWGSDSRGESMQSSNFQETIIGEAVTNCVEELGVQLEQNAERIPLKEPVVRAKVAQVRGDTVIVAAGAADGLYEGLTLEVMRVLGEILDPDTGEVLSEDTSRIGELTVNRVEDRISFGKFAGAADAVNVGDVVKTH